MYLVMIYYVNNPVPDELEFEHQSHAQDRALEIINEGTQMIAGKGKWVFYPPHQIHVVFVEEIKK